MTIMLPPDLEARLRERAQQHGMEIDVFVSTLLQQGLERETQEFEEAVEGIRRGLEDSNAGRVVPAEAVFAKLQAKLDAAR